MKDVYSYFVSLWRSDFDLLDLELFACRPADGSFALDGLCNGVGHDGCVKMRVVLACGRGGARDWVYDIACAGSAGGVRKPLLVCVPRDFASHFVNPFRRVLCTQ